MTRHGHYLTHAGGCRCTVCDSACPHGTVTGYVAWRCRCEACTNANRRRANQYKMRKLNGVQVWGDIDAVHDHIEMLKSSGISYYAIAKAVGYKNKGQIYAIAIADRITAAAAIRILATTIEDLDDRSFVPALGTMRRLRALGRFGYSTPAIATAIGFDEVTLRKIRNGRQRRTRRWVVNAVTAYYRANADRPGPCNRSRLYAERRRWLPPMAWDDEDFDDPRGQARAHSRIKR